MIDYSEITHPTRLRILKAISEEPKSLKDIADILEISRPEVSRHLNRLRNLNLVRKENSLNMINALGIIIIKILEPLDFIFQHYNFFCDHPLVNFPTKFLYELNKLKSGQLIQGSGFIFQKERELAKYAKDKMKLMVNSPIPNVTGVQFEKGQLIVPGVNQPSIFTHENLSKDMKNYEIRIYPEINYSLFIMGDKFGTLHFPNKNGHPDMNSCLFINDKEGMAFLLSLWNYFWDKSTFFMENPKIS